MIEYLKVKIAYILNDGQDNSEAGYTLLEYCAGAAVIAGIIWVALKGLGGNLEDLLTELGNWAVKRTDDIKNAQ